MSVNHYLHLKRKWNVPKLMQKVQSKLPHVQYHYFEDRDLIYAWVEGKSTRGVNVSREDDGTYEFRTTTCSSEQDYALINCIAEVMYYDYGGKFYTEEDEPVDFANLYPAGELQQKINRDFEIIQLMVDPEKYRDADEPPQQLALSCPNDRMVYFGQRTLQRFLPLQSDLGKMSHAIILMMQKVIYGLPEIESGNVFAMEESERTVTMKLITNEQPYIINGFNFVLFQEHPEELPIRVSIYDLPNIKPESWELYDDCTMVTKPLPEEEWLQLLQRAKEIQTPFEKSEENKPQQEYIPLNIMYSLFGEENELKIFELFKGSREAKTCRALYKKKDWEEEEFCQLADVSILSDKRLFSYHSLVLQETVRGKEFELIAFYPDLVCEYEILLVLVKIDEFRDGTQAILHTTDGKGKNYVFYNTNYLEYQRDYQIGDSYKFSLFSVLFEGELEKQSLTVGIVNEILSRHLKNVESAFEPISHLPDEFDLHHFSSVISKMEEIKFHGLTINNCRIRINPNVYIPLLFSSDYFDKKVDSNDKISGILSLQGKRLEA